jgi:hypothetical protein
MKTEFSHSTEDRSELGSAPCFSPNQGCRIRIGLPMCRPRTAPLWRKAFPVWQGRRFLRSPTLGKTFSFALLLAGTGTLFIKFQLRFGSTKFYSFFNLLNTKAPLEDAYLSHYEFRPERPI